MCNTNIKPEDLDNWEQFLRVIEENNKETQSYKENKNAIWRTSDILYRGQSNSKWPLKSTLERRKSEIKVGDYFNLMLKVYANLPLKEQQKWPNLKNQIESLSIESIYLFSTVEANSVQIISFMIFLRHHGFPSPLLDWTRNPLIAAFFAFNDTPSDVQSVTIYSFREHTGYTSDFRNSSEPIAREIGPDIDAKTSRPKNQESHYTLCAKQSYGKNFNDAEFASLEYDINAPGFYIDRDGNDKDVSQARNIVRKYIIPISERNKAFNTFTQENINMCYLFGKTTDNKLTDLWNQLTVNK